MESRPPAAAAAAAAAAAPPAQLTPEEEALKRNTDCVYFLASPLTCKKGSECEYRHSETARVNPRDCYYWLNSNCTNPKCSFRHPPLEGIFSVLPPPVALPPATGYNPTKQSTPCYYFLKGNCVKGDRCLFMHGPLSSGATSIPQQPAKASASIAPSLGTHRKEPSNPSAIAKLAQQPSYNINNTKSTQENPVPNATKPVNFNGPNGAALATTKPRTASTVNNARQRPAKTSLAVSSLDEDRVKYPHPLSRGAQVQNRDMSDERPQDSREGDEFLGESSPGFDVIVDHGEEDSGYLPPNEEEFRRAYADSYNPAEMYPIEDYESLSRYERERHGVMSEHEYEPEFDLEADRFAYKGNDQYDRKRRRRDSSTDRALDRPIRRHSHREETGIGAETGINGSDLRLRLMNKQRKVNGSRSRSDVSPEKREDGHHRHHHRREERHLDEWDLYSSRGMDRADQHVRGAVQGRSRLQGRIKMPPRSAERSDFIHEDVDMEQRRHLRGGARVSPVPVDLSSRRLHDRMGQRLNGREFAGRLGSRRDEAGFSGPKSLAELKGVKPTEKVSEGGLKESAMDFEGPKPLSEILKKKKKVAGMGIGNGSSENKSHNDSSSPKENPLDEEVEEGMISEGNDTDHVVQVTTQGDGADEKAFEEDQEMEEPYDEPRGEGSNYYEGEDGEDDQIEDENAYREEGEEVNEYPEGEEDFEDDDEQDFARKVGVVLS